MPTGERAEAPSPRARGMDRAALLAALRARGGTDPLGQGTTDLPLAPGLPSFARSAVHELRGPSLATGSTFGAVLLGRSGGTALWVCDDAVAAPVPAGISALGLPPARLIVVQASRPADAVWSMEEALLNRSVSGAVLASATELDASAQRRLQLAAAAGGGIGLILRTGEQEPLAEVASRWEVRSVAGAGALSDPGWSLERLPLRGGRASGPWVVTWRAASGALQFDAEATAALRHQDEG